MKVLVTGGAGFIGSHLVDLLIEGDHEVSVVDNLTTGRLQNVNEHAHFYLEDICSREFKHLLAREQPQVVFHEAAQMSVKKSMDDPVNDAEVNVLGMLNLLEACALTGVRKVVFASSGATYGEPDYLPMDEDHPQRPASPYGITKMVGEHYLAFYRRERGLQFTALRYGNVYGPRQSALGEAGVVAIFTTQLLTGQVPTIHWDGKQVRDYVYVGDVARANMLALHSERANGRTYCIGTGEGSTVNHVYSELCRILGVSVTPEHGPRRAGDLRAAYFDTTRAQTDLGWRARVSLADGLARTAAAFWAELRDVDAPPAVAAGIQQHGG